MFTPHGSPSSAFPKSYLLLALVAVVACALVWAPPAALGAAGGNDKLGAHPALEPFNVQGKKLPDNLFLVRTRGALPDDAEVVVLGRHNDVLLVSGDPEKAWDLARRGCAVMPVENWQVSATPAARNWMQVDAPDPEIAAMVAQVEWTGVLDKVQWLVDFGTRNVEAANHAEVAQAIRDKLAGYGVDAVLRPFQFGTTTMWNVEATQVGTRYPDSYVVICGHFDSLSEIPTVSAPGADDNATGTAAVLTAAEILSQHTFDYSIRYICFDAEELGLVGSYFYASDARMKNLDIVGVMNFDMLGYWVPGVDKDLEIETNQASQWLAQAILNAADLYTDAAYELHIDDWAWWGDHFFFWLMGYAGVNHEESWDWYDPDFNPYYHTSQDLPQYIDPGFTVENIRVGVASLATVADAPASIDATFDMLPGSCPNPFNPKSNGVVNAALLGNGDFDVNDISLQTLRVQGVVSPVAVRVADVGSAVRGNGHPCADTTPDGIADLSLKFDTQDLVAAMGPLEKQDTATLRLTCRLVDGTAVSGEDVVVIVGKTNDGPMFTERPAGAPAATALHPNVPNPFNPVTAIPYDVRETARVTLVVYDVGGRAVRTLVDGVTPPGSFAARWDGTNDDGTAMASGIYFVRLVAGEVAQTRKLVLLK